MRCGGFESSQECYIGPEKGFRFSRQLWKFQRNLSGYQLLCRLVIRGLEGFKCVSGIPRGFRGVTGGFRCVFGVSEVSRDPMRFRRFKEISVTFR